jgi:uncharacterized protein YjbI with pentapeptide repeats
MTAAPMILKDAAVQIVAEDANLAGSTFRNVNLHAARLNDVNLAGAVMDNVSLREAELWNVDITGLTIEGVRVEDLFRLWEART